MSGKKANEAYLSQQLSKTLELTQIDNNLQSDDEKSETGEISIYEKSFAQSPTHDSEEPDSSVETSAATPKSVSLTHGSRKFLGNKRLDTSTIDHSPLYLIFPKLLNFLYLGLRLCNENILASDLLRWCRQGKIPYYSAYLLFSPDEISEDICSMLRIELPNCQNLLNQCCIFAKFLDFSHLPLPPINLIMQKLTDALNLPDEIMSHTMKIYENFYPSEGARFIVSVETLMTAAVVLSIKIFHCLDGQHEKILAEIANSLNRILENCGSKMRLFSFKKWQHYMNKMLWWINQIDESSVPHNCERSTLDYQRYCDDFWSRTFYETTSLKDKKGVWNEKMLEKLLDLRSETLREKCQKGDFINAYRTPFADLLDQYIAEGFHRDESKNKHHLLKIAINLKKESMKSDSVYWLHNPQSVVEELKKFGIDLQIVKIPLHHRAESYRIFSSFGNSETHNEKNVLYIPDPFKGFRCLRNFRKSESLDSDLPDDLRWTLDLMARIFENDAGHLLGDYEILENLYVKRIKLLSK